MFLVILKRWGRNVYGEREISHGIDSIWKSEQEAQDRLKTITEDYGWTEVNVGPSESDKKRLFRHDVLEHHFLDKERKKYVSPSKFVTQVSIVNARDFGVTNLYLGTWTTKSIFSK